MLAPGPGLGKNRGMSRPIFAALSSVLVLLLVACAGGQRAQSPDQVFYDYAGTLRWGGFELAQDFVDPAHREQHPLQALELERYRQVEVKGYSVVRSQLVAQDRIEREVEISLVNRHTQRERTLRHRETWRWDPAAQRWWLANGLPGITAD